VQDPIRSSTPTTTGGTTEARATLKSPVEEVPEDDERPKTQLPFCAFCLFDLAERLVINSVLQILWIYVIIKPVFDLITSMTVIWCLK
jgi:hypothetical protein